MKLENLIQARKTLKTYANERVSSALAYKMMKFMKASSDEDAFYNEKIRDVISKFAEKDENGEFVMQNGAIRIIKDKVVDCQKEIDAVGSTDIEKPKITFTLSELNELKLSMSEVFTLDEFITEEG